MADKLLIYMDCYTACELAQGCDVLFMMVYELAFLQISFSIALYGPGRKFCGINVRMC